MSLETVFSAARGKSVMSVTRAARPTVNFSHPRSQNRLTTVFQQRGPSVRLSSSYSGRKQYRSSSCQQEKSFKPYWWKAAAGVGLVGLAFAYHQSKKPREISLEELKRHTTPEEGLWIAWQDPEDGQWYVSAMADFDHPGGDRIREAGGGAAMPHWQKFARHLTSSGIPTPKVLAELRKRVVGKLTEAPPNAKITDPYALEPNRENYTLSPLQDRPYNAGQIPERLTDFYTEEEDLFIRFHTPAPLLQSYSLNFQIGERNFTLTQDDLSRFPTASYASVLQCTGDRRSEMPETNGLKWVKAVGNVKVTGYLLWPILNHLGVHPEQGKYLFVQQLDGDGKELFSTCVPLDQLPEKTMLVKEMNEKPLSRNRGSFRLWLPGFNGNFQVKNPVQFKIVTAASAPAEKVQEYASLGPWAVPAAISNNLRAYIAKEKNGRISFEPRLRVNSMVQSGKIIKVSEGTSEVPLQGWAWSGHGEISAVELSLDGGRTWKRTSLDPVIEQPKGERYAWTGWKANIPIAKRRTEVLIRATDSEGNVQPPVSIWNERGLRVNHQTKIVIEVASS